MTAADPAGGGMTGAESVVQTLIDGGLDTCFANPGTSEMHFVAALDRIPGIRCVLGLHETVVTGMADGYHRIRRAPAATLLHCGPGLANGLANLHNARRARSGIVNIVGDQATWHRPHDAPLTADTESLAGAVSDWLHTSRRAPEAGRDAALALQAAGRQGQGIATLILPSDVSWNPGGLAAEPLAACAASMPEPAAVEAAARLIRRHGTGVLILLGGRTTEGQGPEAAWRIAQATGAGVLAEYVCARLTRGRGRAPLERLAYDHATARRRLAGFTHLVLIGARPPVGFFGYPGQPSEQFALGAQLMTLAGPGTDETATLLALVEALGAPAVATPDPGPRPEVASGPPTSVGLAQTLAALMPEDAIVSDESVSYGRGFHAQTRAAPPHDWLHLTGGAIGDGMPVATGAALAAGGQRRVISLQADGSAMYSLQALWTQARERLPVTTVILSNRRYAILLGEYHGVGATPGPTAMSMLDLSNPALDWVSLAQGMGVEAARAETLDRCADLMRHSFARSGPFLIELAV